MTAETRPVTDTRSQTPRRRRIELPPGSHLLSPAARETVRDLRRDEIELNKRLRALQIGRKQARVDLEKDWGQAIQEVESAKHPISSTITRMISDARHSAWVASKMQQAEVIAVLDVLRDYSEPNDLRMGRIEKLLAARLRWPEGAAHAYLGTLRHAGKVELVNDGTTKSPWYRLLDTPATTEEPAVPAS